VRVCVCALEYIRTEERGEGAPGADQLACLNVESGAGLGADDAAILQLAPLQGRGHEGAVCVCGGGWGNVGLCL
jgi:hypothetical protein